MSQLLLEATGISKRFGGLQALSGVSFGINRGEVYGLIGPNGAGKTTLFNCLTGLYPATTGSFVFDGVVLPNGQSHLVAARGIARTFQNIRLFGNLSAIENVMIGLHVRTRAGVLGAIFRNRRTLVEEKQIQDRAAELLAYVGIERQANNLAKNLSYGDQRRLEIARAFATRPQLLALDEPAAGMNATETMELKQLLQRIRLDGVTILVIEHDVKLMMGLCDRMLVLDYGRALAEDVPAKIQCDPRVINAYLVGCSADEPVAEAV